MPTVRCLFAAAVCLPLSFGQSAKSFSLLPGTHHGTFIRNDIDNTLQKFNFTFATK